MSNIMIVTPDQYQAKVDKGEAAAVLQVVVVHQQDREVDVHQVATVHHLDPEADLEAG